MPVMSFLIENILKSDNNNNNKNNNNNISKNNTESIVNNRRKEKNFEHKRLVSPSHSPLLYGDKMEPLSSSPQSRYQQNGKLMNEHFSMSNPSTYPKFFDSVNF